MTRIDSSILNEAQTAEQSAAATEQSSNQIVTQAKETAAELQAQAALFSFIGEFHQLLIQFGEVLDETNPDMRRIAIEESGLFIDAQAKKKADDAVEIEFNASNSLWHRDKFDDPADYRWATPWSGWIKDESLKTRYVRPQPSAELIINEYDYKPEVSDRSLSSFVGTLSAKVKEWMEKGLPTKKD